MPMFKGMAAITFSSSRHKPCASLPILFSSSTPLLLPTSVQLIQNDSWSQDKYLDKQRLDRVQQEEASNMAKMIGLKYLRKLLSVFWDSLSFERQEELETSCAMGGWTLLHENNFSPNSTWLLSLHHSSSHAQHSASPISPRDSCSKTHPEAEQLDEQCFPPWAGDG